MSIQCTIVPVTPYQQNCSIIKCEGTGRAAIVDPGGDVERIMAAVERMQASVEKIILTHAHMDHCAASDVLRQQLRVPLRLGPNGVSFSSMAPAVATGPNLRVQNHLARIPHLKSPGSVKVEMEGQVAILRGEVGSQHERDLVARLVLLEPGIADVRNELLVPSATTVSPPKP